MSAKTAAISARRSSHTAFFTVSAVAGWYLYARPYTMPLVIEHSADHVRCLLDLSTRHIKMRDEAHTVLIHRDG